MHRPSKVLDFHLVTNPKSPKAKQHNNNCLFMASRITNKY
jgi:hypothetical protein